MNEANAKKVAANTDRINALSAAEIDKLIAEDNCPYEPEHLIGVPLGMFHCAVCGEMVIAGVNHPRKGKENEIERMATEYEAMAYLYDTLKAGFPRFSDDDGIMVNYMKEPEGVEDKLLISYNSRRGEAAGKFALQIEGRTCYILSFEIRQDLWRTGLGRKLVECIEKFCLAGDTEVLITTPSGMGTKFWPAMGFVPEQNQKISAIKKLKRIS